MKPLPRLSKPRKKRDIMLRLDLYAWIEEQIREKEFRNFSHIVEEALEKLRGSENRENRRL